MKQSIFFRTFVLVAIASCIFFAGLFGAFYVTSVNALKEQALQNASNNLDMIRSYLNMTLSSIENSMYLFMQKDILFSNDQKAINAYFQGYREMYNNITVKMLLEGDQVLAIDNPLLLNSLKVDTAFYYGKSQKNRMVTTPPYYSPLVAGRTVAMIRSMIDPSSRRELLLVAEMRTNALFESLVQKITDTEALIVLSPDGDTVYMNYSSGILGTLVNNGNQLDIAEGMRSELVKLNSGVHEVTIGKQRLMIQRMHYNRNWNLYFLVDSSQFYREINVIATLFLYIAIFAVVALLGISLLISEGITRPVKRLAMDVNGLSAHDNALALPVRSRDEIGRLAVSFNGLLNRLRIVGQEKAEFERQRFRMEYKVLQSQIQPHFLFNIHMCIDALLDQGEPEKARQILTALDALLRNSIDKTSEQITLGEEIKTLQHYVALQQIRHGNSFDVVISDYASYAQVVVPKLLLQPIVENAIYHGITNIPWRGEIRISFLAIEDQLHILIEDNGCGIPQDKLAGLLQPGTRQPADKSGMVSIGLDNVQQRIRNFYGAQSGLYVASRENIGTCVEIVVDMKTRDDMD